MNRARILIGAAAVIALQAATPDMRAHAVPLSGIGQLRQDANEHGAGKLPAAPDGRATKRTVPPLAFVRFCRAYPSSCVVRAGRLPSRNGQVIASAAVLSGMVSTNDKVNKTLRKRKDEPGSDIWTVNTLAGDCEDYVLAKRARLLALGWPSASLSIAVVRTREGVGHAVLIVRTEADDFVLDNLRDDIRRLNDTGYHFVSMQDGTRSLGWIAL